MFGQNSHELPNNYSPYFPQPEINQTFPPSQLFLPPLAISGEHDSLSAFRSKVGYTSSEHSSYGGSPTSTTSYGTYSPTVDLFPQGQYFELEDTSSLWKTLTAGNMLQDVNLGQHNLWSNSPLAATECSIMESMNRASPYSPEEKKERIERYRNKRNLRNFNKKIKYECRKTLADSRPRIRGRFARNDHDQIDKTPQTQIQWDQTGVEEDDDNWVKFLDAYSANMMP
ncbi:hypothetical protein OROHE_021478 [Orobanche hederae]